MTIAILAAEPGGVSISSSTYDQVRGKVGIEFADLGEQNLKNIDRPYGPMPWSEMNPAQ